MAKLIPNYPLKRHFKARYPFSNVSRLDETISTDPIFANCLSIHDRFRGAQIFYGLVSHMINVAGMRKKSDFIHVYQALIRSEGAPSTLRRDNALEECSEEVIDLHRKLMIKDEFSEPHHQHQNLVEGSVISWLKTAVHMLLDRVGAPDSCWFLGLQYLADLHKLHMASCNQYDTFPKVP